MHREPTMDVPASTERDAERTAAEAGQTMAEYAVVLGVIVIVTVGVFMTLGDAAGGLMQDVAGRL